MSLIPEKAAKWLMLKGSKLILTFVYQIKGYKHRNNQRNHSQN